MLNFKLNPESIISKIRQILTKQSGYFKIIWIFYCKEWKIMKATGIVRRIDDLGRVVIPKEIRRTMRIHEGDPSLTALTPDMRFYNAIRDIAERLNIPISTWKYPAHAPKWGCAGLICHIRTANPSTYHRRNHDCHNNLTIQKAMCSEHW